MPHVEIVAQEEDYGILLLKWHDTRNIHVFSTKHGPEMEETQRNRRGRSDANTRSSFAAIGASITRSKLKTKTVTEYNKGKVGIDLLEQMCAYSSDLQKGMKWFLKLAF